MEGRKSKIILLLLVIISGLILFSMCTPSVSVKNVTEVSYETPEVFKDTNLGAELPFIAYESEHQLIFYNYMGIFVYDLDNSKMLRSLIPGGSQFYHDTGTNESTRVRFNIDKNVINIYKEVYKAGHQRFEYFYAYDINNDKLYQYPIDKLNKGQGVSKVTGRMDTSDWSAWNLFYTSELTGRTYYPFRSIAK